MNILYTKMINKTHVYSFTVNSGGEYNIEEIEDVEIIFVNGILSNVKVDRLDCLGRNRWRIYAAINEQIEIIEQTYRNDVVKEEPREEPRQYKPLEDCFTSTLKQSLT